MPLQQETASFDAVGALLSKGNPSLTSELLKEVATEFTLVIKFKLSAFLKRTSDNRTSIPELVQKELNAFMKRFVSLTAAQYLISQVPGISDPSRPIEWTSKDDPYLDPYLEFKEGINATGRTVIKDFKEVPKAWNVPEEVSMGYRDLIEETRSVIGGVLKLLIENSYSQKSDKLTELKLLVKAFKPNADINKSFSDVLAILKALNEVLDLDPAIKRVELKIPYGLASSSSLSLWKLFTNVLLDVMHSHKWTGTAKVLPLDQRVKILASRFRG
jgi:hypothetical protein